MDDSIPTRNDFFTFEDNILKTSDVDYIPEGGLGHEFYRFMTLHKENIAQYDAEYGNSETYSSLLKRCIRTALQLEKNDGITRNDIIFLCTNNHMDSAIPFIAATFLGVKVASLDPTLSLADTKHLIENVAKPSVIFLIFESLQMMEAAIRDVENRPKLVIFDDNCDFDTVHSKFSEYYRDFHVDEDDFRSFRTDPEETAVIFFSSGTTGLPKGICQSSYSLLGQGSNKINFGFMCGPCMCYSSLYWISSALLLTSYIMSGTSRVVSRSFDAAKLWKYIEKFKIGYIFLSPIQAIEMAKVGRPDDLNTSSLQILLTGGAPLHARHLDILRDLLPGTFVTQGYGLTEVAGPATIFKVNDAKDAILLHYKPTSCGRPIKGISYKIVDPESEEILGPNLQGELRLKSKFCMNGYYNNSLGSGSDCFDSDGWLKTGDIMYYDEDFCFYPVDRIKDLLKFQGWHIPPAMLEAVISNHRAVRKAVVIGIPHDEDGDHPMAVIIKENGYDDVQAEEIIDFVDEQVLDRQRLRGGVKFIKEFPITPSGKIKRHVLKKMVLVGDI